jgi:hypothetical protein
MKLTYEVIKPNVVQVKMGIKPGSTSDLGLDDAFKKEIVLACDVTIKDLPDDFDLKSVPEVILNHAMSSIKVEVQAAYRTSKVNTKAAYEKAYDSLKALCLATQTHEITLAKSRAKTTKTVAVVDTLLVTYGANRVAEHLGAIFTDLKEAKEEPKEILLKWATIFEKALQGKKK